MSIKTTLDWVTLDTENEDYWSTQSVTFRRDEITGVRLVKQLNPHGADTGLEVKTEKDRFWMRYRDFDKCEADYRTLIERLHAA